MDPWTISLAVVVGALCIYLLSTWNFNYFEKLGIPHVKPVPIFGNMIGVVFGRKALFDAARMAYDCHPEARYVGFFDFLTPVMVLKDPELIKSIAIKNFDSFPNHRMFINSPLEPLFQKNLFALKDETWRDMRALLSPAFTSSKMKMMFKIMSDCAVDFADYLAEQNPLPEVMDMKDTFGRYTLDVIASSAFGLSVNSMKDRDNDFYLMGKKASNFSGSQTIKFFIMKSCPWFAKLMNIRFLDLGTTNYFMNAIETTMATRDAQGIVRPDMIQLMMQARDNKEKAPLSAEDMAAQAFIFFLGGFDGPSTMMSFTAHLLALNPEIQRRLQAEIDEVLEKSAGEISYEDLHGMKYLDAVVNETLRIYPPAAFLDRVGPKSFTLPPALPGLEPVQLHPGQSVWIPVYSFHHDPKYFPNPEKFDPERFSDENKSKISPLTYFPFGIGPRICIANRFALMEIKLALFHVLAKCNFLPTPKTPSVIKLSTNTLNLMPEGGFHLKVEPRQ